MKASKNIIPSRDVDVRPLSQRENPLKTRKGMIKKNNEWIHSRKKRTTLKSYV